MEKVSLGDNKILFYYPQPAARLKARARGHVLCQGAPALRGARPRVLLLALTHIGVRQKL